MKKSMKWMMIITAITSALMFTSVNNKIKAQPGVAVSFSVFYSNLAPYGEWIQDPHYGYVWAPRVAVGFRPYFSNGYWVMTEYGNTWVSDYPWGWAPFHYGRWIYDGFYGWVWVPDEVWGPAWVGWRYGGGVYGWAPLAPGVSISFAFGGGYYCPDDWWVFVPQRYVLSPSFHNYYYAPRYSTNYVRSTTVINNTYVSNGTTYITGPRAQEIQRATGQSVSTRTIRSMDRPGSMSVNKNAVSIYRPRVSSDAGGKATAPVNAARAERSIGKPQALSYNGGKPERLSAPAKKENGRGANEMKQQQAQPKEQASPRMEKTPDRKQPTPAMKQEKQQKMQAPKPKPVKESAPKQMEKPSKVEKQQPAMKQQKQPKMEAPQPTRQPAPKQMEKQKPQMKQPQPQMQKPQQAPQPLREQGEPKKQGGPKNFR